MTLTTTINNRTVTNADEAPAVLSGMVSVTVPTEDNAFALKDYETYDCLDETNQSGISTTCVQAPKTVTQIKQQ